MKQQIIYALKNVFLSYSPVRCLIEALVKYDFKIGEARINLMQLCFSNLASWPLALMLALVYFDPTKTSWSLVEYLSFENLLVLFFLDGRLLNMLVIFLIFFVLEWVLKKEFILISLLFYFLSRRELHIHLATVGILAIYISRIFYLARLKVDNRSETKKIWKAVSILQFLAWGIVAFTTINALDYIQINFLFNEATSLNRFNFLCIMILLYHIFSHLFLSLWGHFYFQQKQEPSWLPVYYSTANWISRFNISRGLKNVLSAKITQQLEKHLQNQLQFQELKLQSPGLAKLSIATVLDKELHYLKQASLYINNRSRNNG